MLFFLPPLLPSSPLSPSLSRAAYYSVLIYKALNVILHVQVKGREWKEKGRGGKEEEEEGENEGKGVWRRIEIEKRASTTW